MEESYYTHNNGQGGFTSAALIGGVWFFFTHVIPFIFLGALVLASQGNPIGILGLIICVPGALYLIYQGLFGKKACARYYEHNRNFYMRRIDDGLPLLPQMTYNMKQELYDELCEYADKLQVERARKRAAATLWVPSQPRPTP